MKELLITNSVIVNGKNEKPFMGSLLIKDGMIAAVFNEKEALPPVPAENIIDAQGAYVTPGFIDIHRHGDLLALKNGDDELLNRQGLTSVVNGNCGLSCCPVGEKYKDEILKALASVTGEYKEEAAPAQKNPKNDKPEQVSLLASCRERSERLMAATCVARDTSCESENLFSLLHAKNSQVSAPTLSFVSSYTTDLSLTSNPSHASSPLKSVSSYMEALSHVNRSVNTGMLVGNGTLRACVKGYATGALTDLELHALWRELEDALSAGVLGVSLGLAYAPEFEYKADDLIKVLSPISKSSSGRRVPITTHVRNEGDGLLPALKEVISVAKGLSVPLHVSHLKCIGEKYHGTLSREVIKLFDEALNDGVELDFDVYPYMTGSTQLVHLLPPSAQKGGTSELLKKLSDRKSRDEITKILKEPSIEFENIVLLAGFKNIVAGSLYSDEYSSFAGKTLEKIANTLDRDPYETLYDILLAEKGAGTMLDTIISEDDMLYFLKDERASLISDAIYPSGGRLHPRVYAAFPKFLIDYVRERNVFSIEEAVYKMTSKPASVFNLKQGVLEKGRPADICVFNLDELKAPADFKTPNRFCEGFKYVFVNGHTVVAHDSFGGCDGGEVIKN